MTGVKPLNAKQVAFIRKDPRMMAKAEWQARIFATIDHLEERLEISQDANEELRMRVATAEQVLYNLQEAEAAFRKSCLEHGYDSSETAGAEKDMKTMGDCARVYLALHEEADPVA